MNEDTLIVPSAWCKEQIEIIQRNTLLIVRSACCHCSVVLRYPYKVWNCAFCEAQVTPAPRTGSGPAFAVSSKTNKLTLAAWIAAWTGIEVTTIHIDFSFTES